MSTTKNGQIALFYTGRKHAGENMADLLSRRQEHLKPPVLMCDALSRNLPENFKIIPANCLAHGRRRFVDVAVNFPDECQYVLETLAKVYQTNQIAKQRKLTPG